MGVPAELPEQYLVDAEGKRTAAVLSLGQYQQVLEDLHDLTIIADRRDGKPSSMEEVRQRLAGDGFLQR